MLCEKELNAFAKSFDLRQPAQSAQAGMGRNLSLSLIFLHVKEYSTSWLSQLCDEMDYTIKTAHK